MKNALIALTFAAALFCGPAVAEDFALPYGLATAPDARLVISDVFDTAAGDGEESIARFASNASREDTMAFYRKALEEAGFEIYSTADNDKHAMIAGKRDTDRIKIYHKNQSDWVQASENEISILAVYQKQ